jgi:hypothetical protein
MDATEDEGAALMRLHDEVQMKLAYWSARIRINESSMSPGYRGRSECGNRRNRSVFQRDGVVDLKMDNDQNMT